MLPRGRIGLPPRPRTRPECRRLSPSRSLLPLPSPQFRAGSLSGLQKGAVCASRYSRWYLLSAGRKRVPRPRPRPPDTPAFSVQQSLVPIPPCGLRFHLPDSRTPPSLRLPSAPDILSDGLPLPPPEFRAGSLSGSQEVSCGHPSQPSAPRCLPFLLPDSRTPPSLRLPSAPDGWTGCLSLAPQGLTHASGQRLSRSPIPGRRLAPNSRLCLRRSVWRGLLPVARRSSRFSADGLPSHRGANRAGLRLGRRPVSSVGRHRGRCSAGCLVGRRPLNPDGRRAGYRGRCPAGCLVGRRLGSPVGRRAGFRGRCPAGCLVGRRPGSPDGRRAGFRGRCLVVCWVGRRPQNPDGFRAKCRFVARTGSRPVNPAGYPAGYRAGSQHGLLLRRRRRCRDDTFPIRYGICDRFRYSGNPFPLPYLPHSPPLSPLLSRPAVGLRLSDGCAGRCFPSPSARFPVREGLRLRPRCTFERLLPRPSAGRLPPDFAAFRMDRVVSAALRVRCRCPSVRTPGCRARPLPSLSHGDCWPCSPRRTRPADRCAIRRNPCSRSSPSLPRDYLRPRCRGRAGRSVHCRPGRCRRTLYGCPPASLLRVSGTRPLARNPLGQVSRSPSAVIRRNPCSRSSPSLPRNYLRLRCRGRAGRSVHCRPGRCRRTLYGCPPASLLRVSGTRPLARNPLGQVSRSPPAAIRRNPGPLATGSFFRLPGARPHCRGRAGARAHNRFGATRP